MPAVGQNVKLEKFSVLAHVLASLTHSVAEMLLAQQRLHSIIHLRVLDVNASAETITTLSTITVLVETAKKTHSSRASTLHIAHFTPTARENFYQGPCF